MCYSLQATTASWVLGTHAFVWALIWANVDSGLDGTSRVAICVTVGWIYFCLLMQLIDFAAWVALLNQKDAVDSTDGVPIKGTEITAFLGLCHIFLQPVACVLAPVVVAFQAGLGWKWVAAGTAIAVAVVDFVYCTAFYITLEDHQRVFHGSRHSGLFHQWMDDPHGAVGRAVKPSHVYNVSQLVASILQVTVCLVALVDRTRAFAVVFTVSLLFWITFASAVGVVGELVASRISSVWCWYVSAGLVAATVLTLWDAWALHAVHAVSAILLTLGSYYGARYREHAMVTQLGSDPMKHVSHAGAIPLLNL